MKTPFITLLFIIGWSSSGIYAQSKEISTFFDNEKMSQSKNIVKTNIESFVHKEIPIYWEHRFSDRNSWEIGVGYLLPYYRFWLIPQLREYPDYYYAGNGLSLSTQLKFYLKDRAKLPYYHIQIRKKITYAVNATEFMTGFGKQWLLGDHLKIDADISLGLVKQNAKRLNAAIYDTDAPFGIFIPIQLKAGYLFKNKNK